MGMENGSRSPAMGVSAYPPAHNGGLMKLMGQNIVSILHGTKHLTRLLGPCPAHTPPIRLIPHIGTGNKKYTGVE